MLLALPPASEPSRDEDATPETKPPAVVSLLAGRLQPDGFVVALADQDEYRIVVDDGVRPTTWDLKVPAESGGCCRWERSCTRG